jgi:hypothetical protein
MISRISTVAAVSEIGAIGIVSTSFLIITDLGNVAFRDTDEPNPFTKPIETKKIIFILDPYLRSRLVPPSDIEKDKRIGY